MQRESSRLNFWDNTINSIYKPNLVAIQPASLYLLLALPCDAATIASCTASNMAFSAEHPSAASRVASHAAVARQAYKMIIVYPLPKLSPGALFFLLEAPKNPLGQHLR